MNTEILIQVVLAVGTVVGGAVAAYATYKSTNSSIKSEDKRIELDIARLNKEIGSGGLEGVERLSNISLANAQFMQQQFMECVQRSKTVETELIALQNKDKRTQIAIIRILSKLRKIIHDHESLFSEHGASCPGFQVLQDRINEIISDVEQEFTQE